MTIPIIGEIWDGIRWVIDFFFNKVPKPILIGIFLIFITLITFLMGAVLHLVGIHCNGAREVVKTDALNVFDNAKIIYASRDVHDQPSYTFSEMFPQFAGNEHDIYFFARFRGDGLYEECINDTTNCTYWLKDGTCFNCTHREICFDKTFFICSQWYSVCSSDAYYTDPLVGIERQCHANTPFGKNIAIPIHYKFNHLTGTFDCVDLDYCGVNATRTGATELDSLLDSMNAVPYYQNEPDQDIVRAFSISCDGYTPTVSFYKIPVFNYKMWVILILIYVMFIFLSHIGQQSQISRK